jgi:hypothetical protein
LAVPATSGHRAQLRKSPSKTVVRFESGMFRIEDERHAEPQEGDFDSFASAVAELKRRAEMRWDEAPNVAPCTNWKDCGRSYEVVEYDTSSHPWTERSRVAVLDVSASGVTWHMEAAAIDDV